MISFDPSKPKLAIIVSRFPYPLEKGDKLRAYYQIKELSKNFNITLFALSDKEVSKESRLQLERYCVQIHLFQLSKWMIAFQLLINFFVRRPFQVGYFYDPRIKKQINKELLELQPDHIYCQLIRVSEYVKNYHTCPKTLDYMDALSKGMERRIRKSNFLYRWLVRSEAQRLIQYERVIFSYFEYKTIISEQDRDLIMHPERNKIICIPNGIDKDVFEPLNIEPHFDLVFVGNMSYAPNIEAVEFIRDLMQLKPELTCLIAGADTSNAVRKITEKSEQIKLLGWVDDIRTAYCSGKYFIAPMMIGTGMQNKLLEAMTLGIPCITTSLANNAIKANHKDSILVADNLKEFIRAIEFLEQNPEKATVIGQNGKKFISDHYTWKSSVDRLSSMWMKP
jgi:glycosyltransferase involved in cell wall biosynthesis